MNDAHKPGSSLNERIAQEQQRMGDAQAQKRQEEKELEREKKELKRQATNSLETIRAEVEALLNGLSGEVVRITPPENILTFEVEIGDFRFLQDGQRFTRNIPQDPFATLKVNMDVNLNMWHLTSSFSREFFRRKEREGWEEAHKNFENSILTEDIEVARKWFDERVVQAAALVKTYQSRNPLYEIEEPSVAIPQQDSEAGFIEFLGSLIGGLFKSIGMVMLIVLALGVFGFIAVVFFLIAAKFFGWVFS